VTVGTSARLALRVYVAPGCVGCRTALSIADAVRQARPEQVVEVVDLSDQPYAPLPAGVVGTPTYLLGDRIISLGNPDLGQLLDELDSASLPLDDE
jgi:hypothetical protein